MSIELRFEMEEFNVYSVGVWYQVDSSSLVGIKGVGKSTLLLQVSTQLSQVGTVLYVE